MTTQKILRLTPEQEARLPVFREEWLRIGMSTERADRVTAERAISGMYREIGREAPRFFWVDSPAMAQLAIHVFTNFSKIGDQLWDQLWDQLRDQLWDQLRDQLRDQLWDQLWDQLRDQLGGQLRGQLGGQLRDQLWDQLGGQLWDQLRDQLGGQLRGQLGGQLWDQLRGQLWDQLRDQLGGQLRDQLGGQLRDQLGGQLRDQLGGQLRDQLWGQKISYTPTWHWGSHDAYWIAFYRFCADIGVRFKETEERRLALHEDVCRSCLWWYPYENLCVVSERPTILNTELREGVIRLHSHDAPAMQFRDGYGIWASHGVRVPQQVIEAPETLTPAQITTESNAEIRRVMLDRFGADRYLREISAQVLDRSDYGTLYRAEFENDEPLVMVEVINSTPEPDGSYKPYMLRVDPKCTRAREAIAWTFGMEEKDYEPLVET